MVVYRVLCFSILNVLCCAEESYKLLYCTVEYSALSVLCCAFLQKFSVVCSVFPVLGNTTVLSNTTTLRE